MTKKAKDFFWKVMAVMLAAVVGVQGAVLYYGLSHKDDVQAVKETEGDAVLKPRIAASQYVAQPVPQQGNQYQNQSVPMKQPSTSSLIRPNAIPQININNMPGGSPAVQPQAVQRQNQAVPSRLSPMGMRQRMQSMSGVNIQDEFARMQAMMDQMFSQSGMASAMNRHSAARSGGLNMRTAAPRLTEKGNNYVVKLTIPGLDKNQVNARVRNNILTLSGTQSEEVEDKGQYGTSYSRSTSSFQNSFSLPGPIKDTGLKVDYKNDTLMVVIPKA